MLKLTPKIWLCSCGASWEYAELFNHVQQIGCASEDLDKILERLGSL